jgi:peroxiredoxin family protein
MSTDLATEGEIAHLRQAIAAMESRLAALEGHVDREIADIRASLPENRVTLVVFSNDLDKLLTAYIIGTGAASLGLDVTMFFTFWGLSALKRERNLAGKDLAQKMMSLMTPLGPTETHPSKMAFMGAGALLMRQMMRSKQIMSLEDLMQSARDLGIRSVACEMSMTIMGISEDELQPDIDYAGVATFLAEATRSKMTLYI